MIMEENMKCRICGNTDNNIQYSIVDKMFIIGKNYEYIKCAQCGCLQIASNISSNEYNEQYYSMKTELPEKEARHIKRYFKKVRNKYAVFKKGIIGYVLYKLFPYPRLKFLSTINVSVKTSILDIGCGTGGWLYELKECGIVDLLGIDPHIRNDIVYENGLTIKKCYIDDLNRKWDLIVFNHSFEHIYDPIPTLKKASNILSNNGYIVIRIPIVDSFAWDNYSTNWVQIDAPRHKYLYSIKAFQSIVEKVDLKIYNINYDSDEFQFWGSEQYLLDIPLVSERSYYLHPGKAIFNRKMIGNFKRRANILNNMQKGDQIVAYLQKKNV